MDQWPQRDKELARFQVGLALSTLIIITEVNKIGKGKGSRNFDTWEFGKGDLSELRFCGVAVLQSKEKRSRLRLRLRLRVGSRQ